MRYLSAIHDRLTHSGLVDQLLQTLKSIDPSRGDRLDDRPEIEEMYQSSVALQGQINALIKKYSDQKGTSCSAAQYHV